MTDRVGQLFGNYRLVRLLGQGGFADAYLAEQVYLKTSAAIKILQAHLSQDDQASFAEEARIIANLHDPHIIRVLDFGLADGTPYLVMDYAPKGTLRQRHRRGVALPVQAIIPYVKDIAAALHYAHTQRVVHRDIKPENMLIGVHDEILLSDFGIAVLQSTQSLPSLQASSTYNVAGTMKYMAPEQILGKPRPASDQYALGIVVYEWLCGVPPFSGTHDEVASQHEYASPQRLREHIPNISAEVERVVLTALAKDPQQRFGSIQAFANALEQAATTSTISTPPTYISADAEQFIATQITQNPSPPPGMTPSNPGSPYASPPLSAGSYIPSTPPPDPSMPQYIQNSQPSQPSPPSYNSQQGAQYSPQTPPGTYITPHSSSQQGPYIPPPFKQAPPSTIGLKITIALLVILLLTGSVAAFFFTVYQPGQQHAQATAQIVQATANATVPIQTTAQVRETATARQNLYAQSTQGDPTMNEPLQGPSNYGWDHSAYSDENNKFVGSCTFKDGAYHSTVVAGYFSRCLAAATNFSNLAYQVEITVLSGHSGGLIIHADAHGNGDYFRISTDGTYILEKVAIANDGNATFTTLTSGQSAAIKTGINQPNMIAIIAQGNDMYIYINNKFIAMASDGTYPSGRIGVYADSDAGNAEVAFRNIKLWKQ